MIYDVEKTILDTIQARAISKKSVYSAVGKTQSGFEYMMKNKSTTVKDLIKIAEVLEVTPCKLFENVEFSNIATEPRAKYLVQQSNQNGNNHNGIEENRSFKEEIDFLRGQVSSLTKMLENALAK